MKPMTKKEARNFVLRAGEGDDLDADDVEAAWFAIFEREPDARDRAEGLWNHLCAACEGEQ